MKITTRYEILDLLCGGDRSRKLVAAEVGTDQGWYACQLLAKYPGLFLYTVDPWLPHPEICGGKDDRSHAMRKYAAHLAPYRQRSGHLRMTSAEAVGGAALPRGQRLDCVYIDAEHTERAVAADLAAWWPLVKVGGLIAGHDFDNPAVSKAVLAFAKAHRLDLQLINEHGGPDQGSRPGSGMDYAGGWAHISFYAFKEREGQ